MSAERGERSAEEATIARVLADHAKTTRGCSCGWLYPSGSGGRLNGEHRCHVAGQVLMLAVRAVVEALDGPVSGAWQAYMDGPGGKTEAFRQGKYEGLDRGRRLAVDALRVLNTPPASPTSEATQ